MDAIIYLVQAELLTLSHETGFRASIESTDSDYELVSNRYLQDPRLSCTGLLFHPSSFALTSGAALNRSTANHIPRRNTQNTIAVKSC
jgi:hypothetical protein